MATLKPISTISYNTEAFLKEKLDSWLDAHIIMSYQYICHKGETDDLKIDDKKDHIHLRIEPNKKLDPMDLMDELREFEPGKDKPLSCRPFRPSKEEDWFLYAVHDETYLKIKYGGGEKGEKIPYRWQDIKVPDNYDLEVAFIRAKAYLEHTSVNMATRLQEGESPLGLILQGENVHTVNAIVRALNVNDYERVCRELGIIQNRCSLLEQAILNYGLVIECDNDGNIILTDVNNKIN